MINNDRVTATIKAFMRPQKMRNCIICAINAGIDNILVGYDGPEDLWEKHKKIVDDINLKYNKSVKIFKYKFNKGLSYVRNRLVEESDTEFFLLLDDDVYVPTNMTDIITLLDTIPEIGAVCIGWLRKLKMDKGKMIGLQADVWDFEFKNGWVTPIINFNEKEIKMINGLVYMYPFDHITNNAIYRKAVWEQVQWDEQFIIDGEHGDFMFRIKNETNWKLAYCISLFAFHDDGGNKEFTKYRSGSTLDKTGKERQFEKWNIKGYYPRVIERRLLDYRRELEWMSMADDNRKLQKDPRSWQ